MKNKISVYLDDERVPNKDFDIIVRTYDECIKAIKENEVYLLSLDNDIADYKEGYDVAKYLVENNISIPNINIHSMNVVASQNMVDLLTRYFPNSRITKVKGL